MAKDTRLDSIYSFLDCYMGESGYDLLVECEPNSKEEFTVIGEFTLNTFKNLPDKNICSALVFEDENENIDRILYLTDNNHLRWTK